MEPKSIEIFENTLLKLLVRQGLDSDRLNVPLHSGELGFSTDTKRFYVGDGQTPGGVLVGNKYLGADPDLTTLAPGQIGDIAFDTNQNATFVISQGTGSSIADWVKIGNVTTAADGSIVVNVNGSTKVGKLSAGNFSGDSVGNSIEIDTSSRIALSATISVDNITLRDSVDITNYLGLPNRLDIGGIDYKFPETLPNNGEFLGTTGTGNQLDWKVPNVVYTTVPSTTATMIPVGSVLPFASEEADVPYGWLLCDGSAVSRTTYNDLFDIIGTTYGTGNGSTTFNVPNYIGSTLYGDSDPSNSSTYPLETTGATLSAKGTVYMIKSLGEVETPTLKVESPLTATLDGVDVTDTAVNPLDGDVVISRGLPGMTVFDAATANAVFEFPEGVTVVKFYLTGSGAGGQGRSGSAAATVTGYLSAAPGDKFTINVASSPSSTSAGGNPSTINAGVSPDPLVPIATSYGATKGATVPNSGIIESSDVIAGYIIPGGVGNVDTSSDNEESVGSASYWGGCPAPGAGGSGEDGGSGVAGWLPGPGIVMFEWS